MGSAVGSIFAAIVFSASVVSLPMMLDRGTDAITSALTSVGAVLNNKAVMLFWAVLIVALTLLMLGVVHWQLAPAGSRGLLLIAAAVFGLSLIVMAIGYTFEIAVGWVDFEPQLDPRTRRIKLIRRCLSPWPVATLEEMVFRGLEIRRLAERGRINLDPSRTNGDHVRALRDEILALEEKGFAYKGGSDVYYRVRKFPAYGKLSGRVIDDLQSGARIDIGDEKEDPLDFTLWKGAKEGKNG